MKIELFPKFRYIFTSGWGPAETKINEELRSVADPLHFGVDPDPPIHAFD
jgi:hypothetical protein